MHYRLLEIFHSQWLIHQETILSYLPVFFSFLNGNKFPVAELNNVDHNKPYVVASSGYLANKWELTDPDLPENSIAVIPIDGILVSWYTQLILERIRMAENNAKISSILFLVRSPGGMVFLIDIAGAAIKTCAKPTVAYVMDLCASAAMWLVSGCNRIFASSEMDRFGGIGAKTSFMDINGLLKKFGLNIYEIYATKSTEKDNEIRRLLAGDEKPVINSLDFVNDIFHKTISDNLGIKTDSEVFKGNIFYARQAVTLGLCHGISDMNTAIDIAYNLGIEYSLRNVAQQLNIEIQ